MLHRLKVAVAHVRVVAAVIRDWRFTYLFSDLITESNDRHRRFVQYGRCPACGGAGHNTEL